MPPILEWGVKTNVVAINQGILNIPEWYVLMGNWRSYSQNTFSEPTLFSQNKRPNAGKCGWFLGQAQGLPLAGFGSELMAIRFPSIPLLGCIWGCSPASPLLI